MRVQLDEHHSECDGILGSTLTRSTSFQRPDSSISSMSKKHSIRNQYTNSLVRSASLSIRMITMLSIIFWANNKYYTLPTHLFPAISLVVVPLVHASTTTMSAFVQHPQRKQMQLDGISNNKFTFSSLSTTSSHRSSNSNNNNDVGGYDPSEGISVSERIKEKSNVGNPQQVQTIEKEFSVTSILKELAAIQQQGPQKYCILGTRHCSYLHQQIIELL